MNRLYHHIAAWFGLFVVGLLSVGCGSSQGSDSTREGSPADPEMGALKGLGEAFDEVLRFSRLVEVTVWIALLAGGIYLWGRFVQRLPPDHRWGHSLRRWLPNVRLLGVITGILVVIGTFIPDAPAARALLLGVVVLAFTWAGRDVIRNLTAGAIVIARNAVKVGDHLRIGEVEGTVTAVSLRGIALRSPLGTRLVVPHVVLHRQITTYVTSDGRARPVTVECLLRADPGSDQAEAIKRTAIRMGRLSPYRAPGTPVVATTDASSGRIQLTVTPFAEDAAEDLAVELSERLSRATRHDEA